MKRIGWQRKDRIEQLEALLNRRLAHWRGEWLGEGSADLELVRSAPNAVALGGGRRFANGEAVAWFQFGKNLERMLGCDALRLEAAQREDFVREIGVRCLGQLLAALFGDEQALANSCEETKVAAESDPRFGALDFEVIGLPGKLTMTVNRAWCDLHAATPDRDSHAVGLSNRRQALGGTPVVMTVSLPLGEIPLVDSLSWRVGEVLVTEAAVNPIVNLESGHSQVAKGRLILRQGERAIEIV
jgi:hypothetical protein